MMQGLDEQGYPNEVWIEPEVHISGQPGGRIIFDGSWRSGYGFQSGIMAASYPGARCYVPVPDEVSIATYCAEKYGGREAQEKAAVIMDYLKRGAG